MSNLIGIVLQGRHGADEEQFALAWWVLVLELRVLLSYLGRNDWHEL